MFVNSFLPILKQMNIVQHKQCVTNSETRKMQHTRYKQ